MELDIMTATGCVQYAQTRAINWTHFQVLPEETATVMDCGACEDSY